MQISVQAGHCLPGFLFSAEHRQQSGFDHYLIIVSATNTFVGCGVYPRPEREGVKPSPTMAKTVIKPSNHFIQHRPALINIFPFRNHFRPFGLKNKI